jgi:hypothetical protein
VGSEQAQALRALGLLAVTAYVGSQFADATHTATQAAVTYVVILLVSIVLHELGHAVAGWAVGAQVTGMRLGFGPRLTPAGSWLDLRPVIVAAHVTYIPPRGARRSQLLAIASAGLVVHLVLIVVALGSGLDSLWSRELAWANVLALASNAIPLAGSFTSTTGGPNDGAHILALLRQRGEVVSDADPDLQQLFRAYDQGGVAAAQVFLGTLHRDVGALQRRLASVLLQICRYDDAATVLRQTGPDPQQPWSVDHLYAEATATTMLLGGAGDLAETSRRAESAMAAIAPTAPDARRAAVAHTLSLVRLLQGRYDEGGQVAAWSLGATEGSGRADVLATMGLAALADGRQPESAQLLHAAMGLDRSRPLVQLLASRIAATPAAP